MIFGSTIAGGATLGLLGAGQVIGRLLYVAMPHTVAPWVPLAVTAGLSAASLALLALVPGPPWLLIVIGIITGAVLYTDSLQPELFDPIPNLLQNRPYNLGGVAEARALHLKQSPDGEEILQQLYEWIGSQIA